MNVGKWLGNLKMTKKLLVSPFVAVVFLAVFGVVSYSTFFKQKAVLDDVFNYRFIYFQTAADILIQLKEIHASMMDLGNMLNQGQAGAAETSGKPVGGEASEIPDIYKVKGEAVVTKQLVDQARTEQAVNLDRVVKMSQELAKSKQLSREEKSSIASITEKITKYRATIAQVVEVSDKDPVAAQSMMMTEAVNLFSDIDKEVHGLLDLERKLTKDQYASVQLTSALALIVSLVVFAAAVILPFGTSLVMKSMILSPIHKTVGAIEGVARGNLTQRIDVSSSDEIGGMAKHFNSFVDKLHGIIGQVAQSSDKVSSSAEVLRKSSDQMAQNIEEVAARVGCVATASEEMSSTTSAIAQNCIIAAKSSESASDNAKNGADVIQSAISAMKRISDRVTDCASIIVNLGARSEQIGGVLGLINDIADQTNLLALNAAIEAARAGEHGRGFAVVADEVRKLAERTGNATKEIEETIKAMQSETKNAVSSMKQGVVEVETGTVEAAKSGQALQDILKQISTVSTEVNQIAVASEEETATTNEIAGSIQEISLVMQQTAAKIQENVDASHQLADLSKELQGMVEQFRL